MSKSDLADPVPQSVRQPRPAAPGSDQPARPAAPPGRRSPSITRTDINFFLDTALLVVFSALVWVSVVIRFIFPAASVAERWTLWSWSLDQWLGVQFILLATLTLGIVLHLMLHWTWVCGVVSSRLLPRKGGSKRLMDDGSRTIFGVGLMIVLFNILGIALAWAALSIRAPI
jgi:hypothetical protein